MILELFRCVYGCDCVFVTACIFTKHKTNTFSTCILPEVRRVIQFSISFMIILTPSKPHPQASLVYGSKLMFRWQIERETLSSNANEPSTETGGATELCSVAARDSLTFSSSVIILYRSFARWRTRNAFMLTPQHWIGCKYWYVILRSSGVMCRKDVKKTFIIASAANSSYDK